MIIKAMNISDRNVLIAPVIIPAMLRLRPVCFLPNEIAPRIIAGMPRRSPGPVRESAPVTSDAIASGLSAGFGVGCGVEVFVVITFSIAVCAVIKYGDTIRI